MKTKSFLVLFSSTQEYLESYINMVIDAKTGYFADGVRKIHYVLTVKEENLPLLQKYITNLNRAGLETETVKGVRIYLFFILIHLAQKYQGRYSKLYNIGLEKENFKYAAKDILRGFHFKKLPKLPYKGGEFTNAMCIHIIDKILETTVYGSKEFDYGLSKLKMEYILDDAYPLHDGPINLHYRDFNDQTIKTCNDRELLYRYWGSFRVWRYEIPLDYIKKYYGYEIAFYFLWLEYFNLMLFPIAVLGVLVIFINIILLFSTDVHYLNEICEADDMYLCPNCALKVFCYYKPLKEYCELYAWTYVFDNYWTVLFAILISFWATFFLNIWVRRTNELKLRWDLESTNLDTDIRREYAEKVKRKRLNNISDEMEPCMSLYEKILRYTFVTLICIIMIIFDVFVIFAVFYFELILQIYILLSPQKFSRGQKKGAVIIAGSVFLVVIIKIKGAIIPIIAHWLTRIEMPKTQSDYDKTLTYKRYILSFCNNYTVLFYTAFVKGVFYVTPNSPVSHHIERDSCQPLPCVMDLTSQLFFIVLFRRTLYNLIRMLLSPILIRLKRQPHDIPQYEAEYRLQPTTRDLLVPNYIEMIIEYGLVTFFAAVFPLAPLFALIDNLIEMRLSARNLITRYRRPIPKKVAGIGPWEGVLLGLIYLSTAINAFVIAFSTQFVSREVYKYKNNYQLIGFLNYTLSEFRTQDYDKYRYINNSQIICYYMAMREPPTSGNKYQLTTEFWANFTWKMVFLVVFEHIILMLNALLSFAIRGVPPIVRDHYAYDSQSVREAQIQLTREQEQTMFMRFRGRT